MKDGRLKRYDKPLAIAFGVLTILFIILASTNESFFNWAFARHQNQLSWYIRPLFLIPFCYFAYKRSWCGIFGTVFLLLTSMFWFSTPNVVNDQVKSFLQIEKEYLTGDWGTTKILISLLIPVSLTALGMAFWKRSLWLGITVLIFIAVVKMLWSVVFGGASGSSVIAPAIIGLVICIVLIFIGFKKLEKKKE
ncbi:hypothetical protein [Dehalobacter sp. 14DCB1]|uniref:hypothetical protein n=1 Tax=Dehalobacter sp. 14DCB1 TaxID=2070227 RepID=UPI001043DD7C|nr:hypothetical protein [Dehalobacter sp. 14DCB1]TCX48921.1 hypothetical protein C1I36_12720 [Dehalobacter sp. 14DCB1]